MPDLSEVLTGSRRWCVEQGDSLELLRSLPSASVHVVLTDPPAGIGFMGKPWDSFKTWEPSSRESQMRLDTLRLLGLSKWESGFVGFMAETWMEVRRVLIPGGLVCAWALPKTADLAGLALRLAGFELKDSLLHLFGSGMNKTGDISKQIDKAAGAERVDLGPKPHTRDGDVSGQAWTKARHAPTSMSGSLGVNASRLTAPATEAAKRWTGWHSGIAPGHEQWLVAQAPGRLTYARQLPERGTGAFNVDACRIPRGESDRAAMRVPGPANAVFSGTGKNGTVFEPNPSGSHPRNVVLSTGGEDCPAEGLDRQSGVLTSGTGAVRRATAAGHQGRVYGATSQDEGTPQVTHGDSGGASRYFTQLPFEQRVGYFPKASDRKVPGMEGKANKHPTHKHPALMYWLCTLMGARAEHTGDLPAVVLDPFNGSGTTGVAAMLAELRYIGFEQDAGHVEVSRARIQEAAENPSYYDKALKRGKYAKRKKAAS